MKKSLLLAAGLMLSATVASAATVYFDNTDNWSPVNAYSWTGGSNNAAWPGEEVTETVTDNGKTYYKYETSFESIIFNNGSDQTKDCTVIDNMIYDPSGATGNLYGGGSIEIVAETYLAGPMTDWSSSDANYKFADKGNGIYTFEIASLSDVFKVVYNGSWYSSSTEGEMSLESGVTYNLYEGGFANEMTVPATASNISFTFDANAMTLKVVYGGGGDVPTPPTPVEGPFNVYFDNSGSNWATPHIYYWPAESPSWPGVAMTNAEGNIWYYTVPEGTTGILFNAGDGDNTKTGDFEAVANHVYNTTGDQGVYNGNTPIDPNPPTPPVYDIPTSLYLIGGTINGSAWIPAEATPMAKEGNTFKVTATVSGAEGSADVYFSFLTVAGADWDEANNADRWGATSENAPISFGTPVEVMCYPVNVSAMGAQAYKLTLDSVDDVVVCDFVVDFSNNTVTVTKNTSSSVASIEVSEAPVYFNLQGVKVAEPTKGIYVKVVNGIASKVVVAE